MTLTDSENPNYPKNPTFRTTRHDNNTKGSQNPNCKKDSTQESLVMELSVKGQQFRPPENLSVPILFAYFSRRK